MQAKEIKKDIYWVGVKDWNLREFHGYATPHGSTYNSYLIMDEKITLVDGVKSYMSQEMTERVKSVVDFSQISYVVVNHVEMDHSGNIPEIMKLAPQAVIITDNAGKMALEAHSREGGAVCALRGSGGVRGVSRFLRSSDGEVFLKTAGTGQRGDDTGLPGSREHSRQRACLPHGERSPAH